MTSVPALRLKISNDAPLNPKGDFILYWMIASRRVRWNFALEEAIGWAQKLKKPLVVLEALRCDYRWASDRLHRFILEGMADNAGRLRETNVFYYPYLEIEKRAGHRPGWRGMSAVAEAFLDQIITWRKLGYNMCYREGNYDQYESLPSWAQRTLGDQTRDVRLHVYTLDQFEAGKTHDPLWNAAQMQLVREGRLHNYLRMLWGKKILEWSPTPEVALEVMIELNNKYALDGRDPNSYSGIFWILGRYDRPWGPERPIFGKIRYMSSANTARKVKVQGYIRKYAPEDSQSFLIRSSLKSNSSFLREEGWPGRKGSAGHRSWPPFPSRKHCSHRHRPGR